MQMYTLMTPSLATFAACIVNTRSQLWFKTVLSKLAANWFCFKNCQESLRSVKSRTYLRLLASIRTQRLRGSWMSHSVICHNRWHHMVAGDKSQWSYIHSTVMFPIYLNFQRYVSPSSEMFVYLFDYNSHLTDSLGVFLKKVLANVCLHYGHVTWQVSHDKSWRRTESLKGRVETFGSKKVFMQISVH